MPRSSRCPISSSPTPYPLAEWSLPTAPSCAPYLGQLASHAAGALHARRPSPHPCVSAKGHGDEEVGRIPIHWQERVCRACHSPLRRPHRWRRQNVVRTHTDCRTLLGLPLLRLRPLPHGRGNGELPEYFATLSMLAEAICTGSVRAGQIWDIRRTFTSPVNRMVPNHRSISISRWCRSYRTQTWTQKHSRPSSGT